MNTFRGFDTPRQNWSKLPNELIDLLPIIDSLGELKVVLYTLRHTWGYSEFGLPKRITLDEFMSGRVARDGTRLDAGTGLSKDTVIDGLRRAVTHGILTVEVDAHDAARVKKYYSLRMKELPADEVSAVEVTDTRGLTSRPQMSNNSTSGVENIDIVHRKKPKKEDTTDANFTKSLKDQFKASTNKTLMTYENRDAIPEHLQSYCDAYVFCTRQIPSSKRRGSRVFDWIATFNEWYEERFTISQILKAYDKATPEFVTRPGSLTPFMTAIKGMEAKEQETSLDSDGFGEVDV
jgi:hypothetical protein